MVKHFLSVVVTRVKQSLMPSALSISNVLMMGKQHQSDSFAVYQISDCAPQRGAYGGTDRRGASSLLINGLPPRRNPSLHHRMEQVFIGLEVGGHAAHVLELLKGIEHAQAAAEDVLAIETAGERGDPAVLPASHRKTQTP